MLFAARHRGEDIRESRCAIVLIFDAGIVPR